jgi:subtilisin
VHENRGHGATITILDSGVDYDHLISGDGPVRLTRCLVASPPFSSCFDDNGHGSHVAGIAASRDDEQGYIGITNYEGAFQRPNVSVKVCGDVLGQFRCPASAVLAALDWTTTHADSFPRQVVNMSFGQSHSLGLAQAISGSYAAGNLLVAAAGNNWNDSVGYPAAYPEVIAVSGTLAMASPDRGCLLVATDRPTGTR